MSSGDIAASKGNFIDDSLKTSERKGRPMSLARTPGIVVHMSPPASFLMVLRIDGVTNWDAIVKSVSFSLSSKS